MLQGELVMANCERIYLEPNGPAVVGVASAANTEAPYIIPARHGKYILLRMIICPFG